MKTIQQKIKENDLSMKGILDEFNSYDTNAEKAKFLREMGQLNLPYDVKWDNLAECYEGKRQWIKIKPKNDNILSDYHDPVGETAAHGDPLSKQELDALL